MNIPQQIASYINSQPEAKAKDMQTLHQFIVALMPACKLWYLDGKYEKGKVVSNPNIGYGQYTITYANGSIRAFYQIGLSANTTGISVYIMGISDKKYLAISYGERIGKANVSGYCIKFKSIKDINLEVLADAIQFAIQ